MKYNQKELVLLVSGQNYEAGGAAGVGGFPTDVLTGVEARIRGVAWLCTYSDTTNTSGSCSATLARAIPPQYELLYYYVLGEPACRATLRFAAAVRVFRAGARRNSAALNQAAKVLGRVWRPSGAGREGVEASIRSLLETLSEEGQMK